MREVAGLLVIILATYALVRIVRTLPGVPGLVERRVKPFSCDVCLSFWCGLALAVASHFAVGTPHPLWPFWALAGAGGSMLILDLTFIPPLPPMEGELRAGEHLGGYK